MTKFKAATQFLFAIRMERLEASRQLPTLHIPVTNLQVMTTLNFVIPSVAEGPAVPLKSAANTHLNIPVTNLQVMTTFPTCLWQVEKEMTLQNRHGS
jgi:hypothetical protein